MDYSNRLLIIFSISIGIIIISILYLGTSNQSSTYIYDHNQNVVVIYPIYTQAAYQKSGFYDYYLGLCDKSCLTVKIKTSKPELASSQYGYEVLNGIGYPIITDQDVSNNQNILKNYDWVIVLHSEYVTNSEYKAITSHKHVLYLYPNALYALIKDDGESITLLKGHGYNNVTNAFNWKYDNHKDEYNWNCDSYKFIKIGSGYELNCFPEKLMIQPHFLQTIKAITSNKYTS